MQLFARMSVASALTLAPVAAFAHGGISAIGALLPFYIAWWTFQFLLAVWVIYGIVIFFTSPEKMTERKIRIYRSISYTFVGLLAALGLFALPFMAIALGLMLLLAAGVIAVVTAVVLSRCRSRLSLVESL